MKNFGLLINKEANAKDWVFGGVTGIIEEPLTNGQWDDFLPVYETQLKSFDTMGCVSWSALNCLETIYKRRYGEEENFSDRFIAKMSGTTVNGNYLEKVAETIRTAGLVDEEYYPWEGNNWLEYYQDVPEDVIERAKLSLERYKMNWEWILSRDAESLKEALKYAPLQVTVYAWGKKVGDIYQYTDKTPNHAVMLYGYEDGIYWKIYDHYDNKYKKVSWDFNFGHRMRYNIETNMFIKKFEDNLLAQDVQDSGAFGLTLDGKLVIDDLAKILSTWVMRNNGNLGGKTLPMLKEDWDLLQKINLKKEPV